MLLPWEESDITNVWWRYRAHKHIGVIQNVEMTEKRIRVDGRWVGVEEVAAVRSLE